MKPQIIFTKQNARSWGIELFVLGLVMILNSFFLVVSWPMLFGILFFAYGGFIFIKNG